MSLLCHNDKEVNKGGNATINDDGFFEAMVDSRLPSKMICGFMGKEFDCLDILVPVIIDEEICFSFNIIDRTEIFKDHVVHVSDFYDVEHDSQDFGGEFGYKEGVGVDTYPRRALMSGADNFLNLLFRHDSNDTDYICNVFLQGFRLTNLGLIDRHDRNDCRFCSTTLGTSLTCLNIIFVYLWTKR
ncbi:ASC domain containing protein [Asbolus verrucosus]|uniref:ASC domain containing protein n=1 Tax=Asbolus verrucosus TaxID=1661398 RepID=A0A482W5M6_ASBVE|nr:ASC domain containing protein [Asbolus verrucosus]